MFAAEREQLLYMYGTRRWCFTKSCTNSTSNLSTVCVVFVHIFGLYYIVFIFRHDLYRVLVWSILIIYVQYTNTSL